MNNKWDARFIEVANLIRGWSKDPSTQVGCVIVDTSRTILATGYNGLPRGIVDDLPERNERPQKYQWYEHAERNAIFNVARIGGTPLSGTTLYLAMSNLKGPPCCDCCRAIIQSGICRIVGQTGDNDPDQWEDRWKSSMLVSYQMIKEAGIIFDVVERK
jgi:dCMP deaminase